MAIFTAIATAIVGALGISTAVIFGTLTVAGLATSIVAAGLMMGTAKILGVFKPPNVSGGNARDPGVKVQVAPGTDNKIPVFYGTNLTGGLIVDAGISNQNDTMTYVIVLGEKTDTGSYAVTKQYRGDQQLVFGTGASAHIVQSVIDANSTATNKVAGKMRCRIYAGGTAAGDQIFPLTNQVAATTMLSTITAATSYAGLVYAVFQIDYDAEEGLTGLGAYSAEITNTLSEPGAVLSDYLFNARYGAGLTADEVDVASIAELTAYATDQVGYVDALNNAQTHDRWAINGMMGTYSSVFTNIDLICQSCSAFFTYNPKVGKFEVVPNRAATTGEKAAAYILTDDNITGAIDVTSTQLYAQYNAIEAEYPDGAQRDQTGTVNVITPLLERNSNEPDNKLTTRYAIVNDPARVTNLSQIDLRQSRKDLVVQLDADYAAIQSEVGDIVKLTNDTYGFVEKLFRVMRVTEKEAQDGMLSVSMVLLEYADSVYTHEVVKMNAPLNLLGIPGWYTGIWGNVDYSNIANVVGNVTVVDDPMSNVANVITDPNVGNVIGTIPIGNVTYGTGGSINNPNVNFPITIPSIPDIQRILANLNVIGGQVGNYVPEPVEIRPPGGRTSFVPGEVVNVTLPQPEVRPLDINFPVGPLAESYLGQIALDFQNNAGQVTARSNSANITMAPKGAINRASIGSVQAGLGYDFDLANFSIANSDIVNAELGQPASQITPADIIDLGGIDYGEFSAVNSIVPYGGIIGGTTVAIAYQPVRQINYKEFDIDAGGKYTPNANAAIIDIWSGSGIYSQGLTTLSTITDNFKYPVSEDRGSSVAVAAGLPPASATKAYVPSTMYSINFANSNLSNTAASRGFDVTNLDKRITKSDIYIDIGGFG